MLVFPLFNSMAPDGSTEGCTNKRTNGGTKLLIELRVRNLSWKQAQKLLLVCTNQFLAEGYVIWSKPVMLTLECPYSSMHQLMIRRQLVIFQTVELKEGRKEGVFHGKLGVVRVLTSQWEFASPSSIFFSLGIVVRNIVPLFIHVHVPGHRSKMLKSVKLLLTMPFISKF